MNILGPLLIALGCLIITSALLYGVCQVKLQSEREAREWVAKAIMSKVNQDIEYAVMHGKVPNYIMPIVYGDPPHTAQDFDQLADYGDRVALEKQQAKAVVEADKIINRPTDK